MKRNKHYPKIEWTYKAIIVNSVDIFLLGDHITKATTSSLWRKCKKPLIWTQDTVYIIAIVEFIIKAIRDHNCLWGITILDNNEMIWLKKRSKKSKFLIVGITMSSSSLKGGETEAMIIKRKNGIFSSSFMSVLALGKSEKLMGPER